MDNKEPSIDRKRFLQRLAQAGAGTCLCAPVLGLALRSGQEQTPPQSGQAQDWIGDLETRMVEGSRTPAWRRMEKAEQWILRLMNNLDAEFDEETRTRLMQGCGRACYIDAFGVASEEPPPPDALDSLLSVYQARGETEIRREGNTVYYQYGPSHQNPYGLRLGDGYCMCVVVESGPVDLSPTYCQCSAGYVKESFERVTGSPCRVEVLETLRSGGSACRFKIDIQSA